MATYIIFGLGFTLALFLGFYFGKIIAKTKHAAEISTIKTQNLQLLDQLKQAEINEDKFNAQIEDLRLERENTQNELTRRVTLFESLKQKNEEQKDEVNQLNEKFKKEFENLAHKILQHNSSTFTAQNKENIKTILDPLQEKIKSFEEKVERNNSIFTKQHAELGVQLRNLNEQNLKISEEATNLTKALKGDSKMQGNWGEMILESVLERSGLQKNSEYFVQQNFVKDDGRRQMPDVVIHLPGNKKMIIDSKVSLVAYERYVNETDDAHKTKHLNSHLIAVRNRVDELSQKNYQQLYDMESPDFVLLFIPIESAFAIASNAYPQLYSEAFDKNIIIVTPTTLLAVLRTIDSMWQNEKQKQNAISIAKQAGALYDSFVNLTNDMLLVKKQMGTVQASMDKAIVKLNGRGNLVSKVEKLKKLGAKASKQIDQTSLKKIEQQTN